MPPDDKTRLRDMLDYARDAHTFIQGRSQQDLEENRMLLFALVRCIEVIGEAANEVSHDLRTRSPHIPWRNIIGMRNRLIHGYGEVDLAIVWQTVTVIPQLSWDA